MDAQRASDGPSGQHPKSSNDPEPENDVWLESEWPSDPDPNKNEENLQPVAPRSDLYPEPFDRETQIRAWAQSPPASPAPEDDEPYDPSRHLFPLKIWEPPVYEDIYGRTNLYRTCLYYEADMKKMRREMRRPEIALARRELAIPPAPPRPKLPVNNRWRSWFQPFILSDPAPGQPWPKIPRIDGFANHRAWYSAMRKYGSAMQVWVLNRRDEYFRCKFHLLAQEAAKRQQLTAPDTFDYIKAIYPTALPSQVYRTDSSAPPLRRHHHWWTYARVPAHGTRGHYLIQSNVDYIPPLPPACFRRLRINGFYGPHELLWYAQWHQVGLWHHAFILTCRDGLVHNARHTELKPHRIELYKVSVYLDFEELGNKRFRLRPALFGAFGRAFATIIEERDALELPNWTLLTRPHEAELVFSRGLQYLAEQQVTERDALETTAALQRSIGELRAWNRFMSKRKMVESHGARPKKMLPMAADLRVEKYRQYTRGVFTEDEYVAKLYAQYGVPVFYVQHIKTNHWVPDPLSVEVQVQALHCETRAYEDERSLSAYAPLQEYAATVGAAATPASQQPPLGPVPGPSSFLAMHNQAAHSQRDDDAMQVDDDAMQVDDGPPMQFDDAGPPMQADFSAPQHPVDVEVQPREDGAPSKNPDVDDKLNRDVDVDVHAAPLQHADDRNRDRSEARSRDDKRNHDRDARNRDRDVDARRRDRDDDACRHGRDEDDARRRDRDDDYARRRDRDDDYARRRDRDDDYARRRDRDDDDARRRDRDQGRSTMSTHQGEGFQAESVDRMQVDASTVQQKRKGGPDGEARAMKKKRKADKPKTAKKKSPVVLPKAPEMRARVLPSWWPASFAIALGAVRSFKPRDVERIESLQGAAKWPVPKEQYGAMSYASPVVDQFGSKDSLPITITTMFATLVQLYPFLLYAVGSTPVRDLQRWSARWWKEILKHKVHPQMQLAFAERLGLDVRSSKVVDVADTADPASFDVTLPASLHEQPVSVAAAADDGDAGSADASAARSIEPAATGRISQAHNYDSDGDDIYGDYDDDIDMTRIVSPSAAPEPPKYFIPLDSAITPPLSPPGQRYLKEPEGWRFKGKGQARGLDDFIWFLEEDGNFDGLEFVEIGSKVRAENLQKRSTEVWWDYEHGRAFILTEHPSTREGPLDGERLTQPLRVFRWDGGKRPKYIWGTETTPIQLRLWRAQDMAQRVVVPPVPLGPVGSRTRCRSVKTDFSLDDASYAHFFPTAPRTLPRAQLQPDEAERGAATSSVSEASPATTVVVPPSSTVAAPVAASAATTTASTSTGPTQTPIGPMTARQAAKRAYWERQGYDDVPIVGAPMPLRDALQPSRNMEFNGRKLTPYEPPADDKQYSWPPNDERAWIVWHIAELDFRLELLTLDDHLRTTYRDDEILNAQSNVERRQALCAIWCSDSLVPSSENPLVAARWKDRVRAVVAVAAVVSAWPRVALPEHPAEFDTEDEFVEFERHVWSAYARTYADYYLREAPVPLHRPDLPSRS